MIAFCVVFVTSKPVAMLRGHNGPITKLAICEAEARVYTISTDKTVKVLIENIWGSNLDNLMSLIIYLHSNHG